MTYKWPKPKEHGKHSRKRYENWEKDPYKRPEWQPKHRRK